jgi:hypothetical protein
MTLTASLSHATSALPKQAIKTNGQLLYQKQKTADSFKDMFQKGDFYGRLRSNNFYFGYDHDDSGHESNLVGSAGASFVYKSATLNNFDFTLGLYGSQAFFSADDFHGDIAYAKAAKDTFSRYKYATSGSKSLFAFGQANLNYNYSKTNFTLGRQLVETFYTKSNDTKMIPNTFDGFVVTSKDITKTKFTLAYLAKQKLRDHENAHSVLMYDNSDTLNYSQWSGNDDSAMHKGLSYTALKAAGKSTDAPLIVFDAQNNSVKNLKINFSSYLVPAMLSQAMGELNYKMPLKDFSITPGVRYIHQFDNGAGAVGGASITTNDAGYKNPNSLQADMIAARVVTKIDDYKINLAYTQVLDKADLVTPWRGFPTAGYTRSMGMYNWRANVKSYRLELVKGANAKGIYTKPFIQTSVLYIDGDKAKAESDSMFYYAGLVQNIPSMQEFQYRVRLGWRDFIGDSSQISDYLDARLEFNYLF